MRLERIQLRNFRCFEALDLELHPEVTLLVGMNGSGKTAVLDAIAVALGAWFVGFPDVEQRPIAPDELRRIAVAGGSAPSLQVVGPTRVAATGTVLGEDVSWARAREGLEGRTTASEAIALQHLAERAHAGDLPVLAYYGTARGIGRQWRHDCEPSDRLERLESVLQGYQACLDPGSGHALLEACMAEQRAAHIEVVTRAAELCVEGAKRFYYSIDHRELRIDFHDGRTLPFHMLSDGHRNLLGLAADIAWRALQLNPHHGAEAAHQATGVVLIDEVDLHLHPRWHRRVLPDLRRAFPNLQIVATTNSPQVISTAPAAWLRVLGTRGEPPRRVAHTLGRDSNSLLEDILGVPGRPEDAASALRHLFDLIDRGALLQAERRWQALRDQLGPHDPDIVRARTILDLESDLPGAIESAS